MEGLARGAFTMVETVVVLVILALSATACPDDPFCPSLLPIPSKAQAQKFVSTTAEGLERRRPQR